MVASVTVEEVVKDQLLVAIALPDVILHYH